MVKHDQPVVSFAIFAPSRLRAFAVRFSGSLRTQQLIGEALGALDDGITLLRDTNATFEAIAQALFKSWFVDFEPSRKAARLRAFAVRFSGSFWRWANRLTVTPAMRLAKAYPSTKDGQILVPIALRADGRSNRVFRENRPFPQA